MIKLFAVFALVISCSGVKNTTTTSSKENSLLHFDVKKKVLDNGLTILALHNEKLPIFTFYTYYKVGGKYERVGTTGASHLLEHMMFKGAKKYGEGKFNILVEGNGGVTNAYTNNDLTVYYETLPKEHFEVIADMEADRMENLLLAKESFEKERLVVFEERRMRYENSDRGKLYLSMMKNLFKGTPYGRSVIGTVKDLQSITRQEVQKYFKKFYAPNNAVIVVVGDIKTDDVFETIEKKFSDLKPNKDLYEQKRNLLSKEGFEFSKNISKTLNLKGASPTPTFMMGLKGVKIGSKDSFTLDILASILGNGESSYLSQKFVLNKRPKAQAIYASNFLLQDSGAFFFGGQLNPKVNVKKFKKELVKSLSKSCDMAITQRAVDKVLNNYLTYAFKSLDTNAGIAEFLGDREVNYGSYDFYEREFDVYRSITIDQLKSACKKYIANQQSVFITIGK